MNQKHAYPGIDWFRFAAALLIVAIHTSPLSMYSETADFIFTRIIARVAVPFFFMTSGFFLDSGYGAGAKRRKAFVKKTAVLYGIAIALYLPLNIYNGYFSMEHLLPNLLKDVLFDGTFYHLWYLPASILGTVTAWVLVKKLGFKGALFFTAMLYLIGLFGDSYYGFSDKVPMLKALYSNLFEISDYTRNGFLFAPIFFVLGGWIADGKRKLTLKMNLTGLAVSFTVLLAEGLLLHKIGVQRHDSMYFMLVPCMLFLFRALTCWKGRRVRALRTVATLIYIIHPMMIAAVRGLAKIAGMRELLVDNSLVHYCAVAVSSVMVSSAVYILKSKLRIRTPHQSNTDKFDRAWIQIDRKALRHNVKALQAVMPENCRMMAVVKAEGYGHGAVAISECLNSVGVTAFAVATIDEGIELRKNGVYGEILIMGYTSVQRARDLKKYDLIQTLIDYRYAVLLDKQGYMLKVHLKVDTGMHRLGFDSTDVKPAAHVFQFRHLRIHGIYTHLCVCYCLEARDVTFTVSQLERFFQFLDGLRNQDITIPSIHVQSSYGLLNYPELNCNYARIGIALYGALSAKTRTAIDLRPVLSLKSRIVLIRTVLKGDSVGYGRCFIAQRNTRIALVPIGYADGLPRVLSCNKGSVLIQGCRAPVIGQICMDQLTVDITDIPYADTGDIVTLIGKDGTCELRAGDVADCMGSIANELLSGMGDRLKTVIC